MKKCCSHNCIIGLKIKKWYYLAAHWHLGNVMVGSITFYDFAVFDVLLAVNMWYYKNYSFFTFIEIDSSRTVVGSEFQISGADAGKLCFPYLVAGVGNACISAHCALCYADIQPQPALTKAIATRVGYGISRPHPTNYCLHRLQLNVSLVQTALMSRLTSLVRHKILSVVNFERASGIESSVSGMFFFLYLNSKT